MSKWNRLLALGFLGGKGEAAKLLQKKRLETDSDVSKSAQALRDKIEQTEALKVSLPEYSEPDVPHIDDLLLAAERELVAGVEELDSAEKGLQHVKYGQGLMAPPLNPNPVQSVLTLGASCMIDAGINCLFIMNAHMTSGAGSAILSAFVISTTNVLASATAGYYALWRDYGLNTPEPDAPIYKRPRQKAKLIQRVYYAAIGIFHTSVGMIRSQEDLHDISFGLSDFVNILKTPDSVFLIIVGVCLSALAWRKGKYGFADYPGYEAMQRAVFDAQDAIEDTLTDYQTRIGDRFSEALASAKASCDDQEKQIKTYNAAVQECKKLHGSLSDAASAASQSLRTDFTKINDHYSAGGLSAPAVSEAELNALCDLSDRLINEPLPEYLKTPDLTGFKSRLDALKHTALVKLSSLCSR